MPKIVTNSVNYSKNDKNRDENGLITTFFRTQEKGCPSPDSLLKKLNLQIRTVLPCRSQGRILR